MCGIIHTKRYDNKSVAKITEKRYQKQKQRGMDGFGYCALRNGKLEAIVLDTAETGILAKLEKENADEIMFHHRLPTSTPNLIEATHPIVVKNDKLKYNYYVINNGIITNADALLAEHKKRGFNYTTKMTKKIITEINTYGQDYFNDSEALAIELALRLEGKKETIDAYGSIAFIALQVEKQTDEVTNLYFGRNYGSPLCIEEGKGFISIKSEGGKSLMTNTLYCLNYATNKITEDYEQIGYYEQMGFASLIGNETKTSFSDEDEDGYWELKDEEMELENALKRAQAEGNCDMEAEHWLELEYIKRELKQYDKRKKQSYY